MVSATLNRQKELHSAIEKSYAHLLKFWKYLMRINSNSIIFVVKYTTQRNKVANDLS